MKVAPLRKNRDIKIHRIDTATPGIPSSAHQCMVTPKTAPIEEKLACSARDPEEDEDALGNTKLEVCGFVEMEMNGEKVVKYEGWRGGLDPSCEKEEEEEC